MVAGEASGDTHAANLAKTLREADPGTDLRFFGAAGPKMRDAGVEAIVRSDDLSIVGLPEIGRALPMFYRAFRALRSEAVKRRPNVVVLVDFPDFNLKLARSLKKQGLTVVYYISPQLWAWRRYRVRSIRRYVDLVISILPFEKDWYADHGVLHVEYVGNPLAREVHPDNPKTDFCAKHDIDPAKPMIALLPGSRHAEITRILPLLIETAEKIRAQDEAVQFIAALPPGKLASLTNERDRLGWIKWIEGETYDALNASDAAAITSGTATLEAGIIGTPMVIVYKSSAINYRLLRPLIDVPFFGLINLIAEKEVAKELIQSDFTPENTAAELMRLLEPETNASVRLGLREAAEKLGHGGASKRAANAIMNLLRRSV